MSWSGSGGTEAALLPLRPPLPPLAPPLPPRLDGLGCSAAACACSSTAATTKELSAISVAAEVILLPLPPPSTRGTPPRPPGLVRMLVQE